MDESFKKNCFVLKKIYPIVIGRNALTNTSKSVLKLFSKSFFFLLYFQRFSGVVEAVNCPKKLFF